MKRFPLVLAIALATTTAQAADTNYCKPYATKLTQAMINYVWNRAYTSCLNVEGADPAPPNNWLTAWRVVAPQADLKMVSPSKIDVSKVGNVPATDDPILAASAEPPSDPAVAPVKNRKTRVADATPQYTSGAPQALCTSHKMRTVYTANGKSWNCRK